MVIGIAYATVADIKKMVDFPSEITDQQISDLIPLCTAELNADINVLIVREKVEWIDETRENDIDGTNTSYYVKDWKDFYIGDMDNDGDVDTSDVTVIGVDADDVEYDLTVSSVTYDAGKIVLSSAPESSYDLYITYSRAPIDESTPHPLVKIAVAQLVGAYAFLRIDAKLIRSFRIGKVAVTKQAAGFERLYKRYRETINRILKETVETGEGEIIINSKM